MGNKAQAPVTGGRRARWARAAVFMAALALLSAALFMADNKYRTPPPYGRDGAIELTQADMTRSTPLFLIDGWLLSDARADRLPTYIGQFSSLQRGDLAASPHGAATYTLTLRYDGAPVEAALYFPQLYARHRITLDGALLDEGAGGARCAFTLTRGDHVLEVETVSARGYYSGIYHPPALGTVSSVSRLVLLQCAAYALALFAPLTLALFTLTLWRRARDRASLWFGLLCVCAGAYVSYYFVRLFRLDGAGLWFLPQSAALYGLCLCVIRLTALLGGGGDRLAAPLMKAGALAAPVLLALASCIPLAPWVLPLHGALSDLFCLYAFGAVAALARRGAAPPEREARFARLGCVVFGGGLLADLLTSPLLSGLLQGRNLFEPLRFFWPQEWCALLLTVCFGAAMAARSRRLLAENAALQTHLEEQVAQRTAELQTLLQERKAFFADMVHDLKAPVFAAGTFIQAIRAHNTGVDSELTGYIELVEQAQQETARRVRALTEFNRIDAMNEPFEAISVRGLLEETYQLHHMAAEVQSVYLTVETPQGDGYLYAQSRKLEVLLENLIFNALKATPPEGRITLSARLEDGLCHLRLSDTGCGIPPEELPHLFDRFFVGRQNEGSGSGLGLYIVKSIVDGLHGQIRVASQMGQGTVFSVDLPLMRENT